MVLKWKILCSVHLITIKKLKLSQSKKFKKAGGEEDIQKLNQRQLVESTEILLRYHFLRGGRASVMYES